MASLDGLRRLGRDAVTDQIVPGLVVTVGVAGETPVCEAIGARQTDPAVLPATTDTVYDLASLTKPLVTSLLSMQAVAAGTLSLDEPLVPGTGAAAGRGPTLREA